MYELRYAEAMQEAAARAPREAGGSYAGVAPEVTRRGRAERLLAGFAGQDGRSEAPRSRSPNGSNGSSEEGGARVWPAEWYVVDSAALPPDHDRVVHTERKVPPPSRTKWTRLVHPSVLIGHVSSLRRMCRCRARWWARAWRRSTAGRRSARSTARPTKTSRTSRYRCGPASPPPLPSLLLPLPVSLLYTHTLPP